MSGFSRLLIAGITAALFLLVMYACMDTSAPTAGADVSSIAVVLFHPTLR